MKKKFIKIIGLTTILLGMVFTSLAYFTDRDEVVNTFTTGKIEIELDEPRYVELNNEGAKLLPGQIIEKDPTVTIKAGSEDLYLAVYVKNGLHPFIGDLDIDGAWGLMYHDSTTNESLYVYHGMYSDPLYGYVPHTDVDLVLEALFTEFMVPTNLDNEDFMGFDPAIHNIEVKALALQALENGNIVDFDVLDDAVEAAFGIIL